MAATFPTAGSVAPIGVSFNSQPDPVYGLPDAAADKLRMLRQHVADLHSLCVPFEDRHETASRKVVASDQLKRLRSHPSAGGFGLSDGDARVSAAERELDRCIDECERLEKLNDTRTAVWTAASQLLTAVQTWLRDGRPPGTVLEDFDGPEPSLQKGERITDAIERHRRRVRELQSDAHVIRSAPYPASYAKTKLRAQIEALAQAPSVSEVIENDRSIAWPTTSLQSQVMNGEVPALAFAQVPDLLAVFCWLHKPALLAALDREIDAEADDKAALTHEVRQQREAVVLSDKLAVERDECALVWLSQGLVEHRSDISPLALLGVSLVTAPRAAVPKTSPDMSFGFPRR